MLFRSGSATSNLSSSTAASGSSSSPQMQPSGSTSTSRLVISGPIHLQNQAMASASTPTNPAEPASLSMKSTSIGVNRRKPVNYELVKGLDANSSVSNTSVEKASSLSPPTPSTSLSTTGLESTDSHLNKTTTTSLAPAAEPSVTASSSPAVLGSGFRAPSSSSFNGSFESKTGIAVQRRMPPPPPIPSREKKSILIGLGMTAVKGCDNVNGSSIADKENAVKAPKTKTVTFSDVVVVGGDVDEDSSHDEKEIEDGFVDEVREVGKATDVKKDEASAVSRESTLKPFLTLPTSDMRKDEPPGSKKSEVFSSATATLSHVIARRNTISSSTARSTGDNAESWKELYENLYEKTQNTEREHLKLIESLTEKCRLLEGELAQMKAKQASSQESAVNSLESGMKRVEKKAEHVQAITSNIKKQVGITEPSKTVVKPVSDAKSSPILSQPQPQLKTGDNVDTTITNVKMPAVAKTAEPESEATEALPVKQESIPSIKQDSTPVASSSSRPTTPTKSSTTSEKPSPTRASPKSKSVDSSPEKKDSRAFSTSRGGLTMTSAKRNISPSTILSRPLLPGRIVKNKEKEEHGSPTRKFEGSRVVHSPTKVSAAARLFEAQAQQAVNHAKVPPKITAVNNKVVDEVQAVVASDCSLNEALAETSTKFEEDTETISTASSLTEEEKAETNHESERVMVGEEIVSPPDSEPQVKLADEFSADLLNIMSSFGF
ncbi:hypothetical protein HDU76_001517 [Blyttiomyces sp. JEL0837]|nr:hypothetical protein HDU76_001517 [Blyttiomyces sp. JEL0837]